MIPDLHLRPATPADLPAVAALANWAYRGEGGPVGWTAEGHLLGGPRTDEAALRELLSQHATDHAALLLAHAATGQLIGCVFLHPQPEALYLGLLTVAPDRQGTGLGQLLLSAAEAYARQHRRPVVRMTVLEARPELLAWYARRGYRPTGRTEQLPAEGRHGQAQQPLTLLVLEKSVFDAE
ncbi:GNAT family N-acetyltransferase [Hymenobacter jeollabukensis]|uniref:GNAT family N-acetyltransferase n=1 Tax=Hymenobacter jeollabukensis TaxID=2025313 RepID=A0A5R8WQF8_9BACT|nr:GNAT family N-acetyltransferase [Hymenobacter jeollabukensis]TLM92252.1 GNAT family N-acetyltransferase [Hymenobacter jeollabukensis]